LRDRYGEIRDAGAEVVTVGTGSAFLGRAFVDDYRIPYAVLLDDDAQAAHAAQVQSVGLVGLFHPDSFPGAARAWKAGHRIGLGKRTNQLGATFVVGPGDIVRYEHYDAHTADHAPMEEILGALSEGASA